MKKLVALAAMALVAVSAQAATVSYSFPSLLENMEIDHTGSLGLFDSSLGNLTGATLSVSAEMLGEIMLTYGTSQVTSNVRGTNTAEVGFSSSLGAINSLFNGIADMTLSYTTGFQSMAPNSQYNSGILSDSDLLTFDLSTVLASLSAIGGGSFDLSCKSLSTLGITGGGGFAGGDQTTQGACGATIAYIYDEATPPGNTVPEPATLSLFGLAALGLAAGLRRKSK